jgi:hypothetical protein
MLDTSMASSPLSVLSYTSNPITASLTSIRMVQWTWLHSPSQDRVYQCLAPNSYAMYTVMFTDGETYTLQSTLKPPHMLNYPPPMLNVQQCPTRRHLFSVT